MKTKRKAPIVMDFEIRLYGNKFFTETVVVRRRVYTQGKFNYIRYQGNRIQVPKELLHPRGLTLTGESIQL